MARDAASDLDRRDFLIGGAGVLGAGMLGATGALAVVMVALVADHGVEYLFATVVLMGIIQIAAGVLKLGKFIRMVPHPVMLGFVNGLAIVIFLAQLQNFQVTSADGINYNPQTSTIEPFAVDAIGAKLQVGTFDTPTVPVEVRLDNLNVTP